MLPAGLSALNAEMNARSSFHGRGEEMLLARIHITIALQRSPDDN
jgi:hypothetical protein